MFRPQTMTTMRVSFFQWELQVILPNTADSTIEMCGKNKSLGATSNVYLQSSRISDTHTHTHTHIWTFPDLGIQVSFIFSTQADAAKPARWMPSWASPFSFSLFYFLFLKTISYLSLFTGNVVWPNRTKWRLFTLLHRLHRFSFFQQFMYNSFLISSSVTLIADSAWEMKSAGRMTNSAKAPTTRRTSVAIFAALFVYSLITVARSQENELFQCPEGEIF